LKANADYVSETCVPSFASISYAEIGLTPCNRTWILPVKGVDFPLERRGPQRVLTSEYSHFSLESDVCGWSVGFLVTSLN